MGIHKYNLSDVWMDSTGQPLELFTGDSPEVTAGTFVIGTGDRIPDEGVTSHDGHEISVILSGEVILGTSDGEITLSSGTLVVIPAGTEHYSENRREEQVRLIYTVVGSL